MRYLIIKDEIDYRIFMTFSSTVFEIFCCTMIKVYFKNMVDFRLSRGCGIEFKKHFAKIKTNCSTIIEFGPIMWPTLIAPNAIPGGF